MRSPFSRRMSAKNMPKSLCYIKKLYLCTAFEQCTGLWCNGNTADSGPAFPGSSPGSPAKLETLSRLFFFCWATRTRTRKGRKDLFLICYANPFPSVTLAALRAGALPGPILFLVCYANALHFITLGGPPGPRSRSKHSLAPIRTHVRNYSWKVSNFLSVSSCRNGAVG